MSTRKIAFPADGEGLSANLSAHFGHVSGFTAIEYDVDTFDVVGVEVLKNAPHEYGGCMMPVMVVKDSGVDQVIVGGIGQRPLMGFAQVGIQVYGGIQGTVKENFEAFAQNKLQPLLKSSCSSSNH